MVKILAERIQACHVRAAECRETATGFTDENLKKQYLDLAGNWMHLAQCYAFMESLERFLVDAHKPLPTQPVSPVVPSDAIA